MKAQGREMIFPRSHGQWVEEVVLNSFIQEIFSRPYYVPGTVLGAGDGTMAKVGPDLLGLTTLWWQIQESNSTYHHFRCYISVRKEVLWRQNPISSKDSNPCFLLPSAGSFHYTTLPALSKQTNHALAEPFSCLCVCLVGVKPSWSPWKRLNIIKGSSWLVAC